MILYPGFKDNVGKFIFDLRKQVESPKTFFKNKMYKSDKYYFESIDSFLDTLTK